jgi:hypothetical protein
MDVRIAPTRPFLEWEKERIKTVENTENQAQHYIGGLIPAAGYPPYTFDRKCFRISRSSSLHPSLSISHFRWFVA